MVSRFHFQSNEKDFRKHDLWVIWIGLGRISEKMGLCIMGEKCSGVMSFWVNMGQNNKKERKRICQLGFYLEPPFNNGGERESFSFRKEYFCKLRNFWDYQ